jgi:hypothetical protein
MSAEKGAVGRTTFSSAQGTETLLVIFYLQRKGAVASTRDVHLGHKYIPFLRYVPGAAPGFRVEHTGGTSDCASLSHYKRVKAKDGRGNTTKSLQ